MNDPLKPSASLLCKLGSIVVHVDEATSSTGHRFDWVVMKSLLLDSEVAEWLDQMGKLAMLPVKR